MKKKIDELLNGKFEYELPRLLFSQEKITVTLKAGDVFKGEIYFGTEDNRKIRGYITSSERHLVPESSRFSGTSVRLQYGADGTGMKPGDKHEGWLCFTTNIGEYKIPFTIRAEQEQIKGDAGEVRDMDSFLKIAREDFREAYLLFTDKNFPLLLNHADLKEMALYKGLARQPVTYQNLEEFLVETGRKEQVRLEMKEDHASFYEIHESVRESFLIHRSNWGHLRLDVEARGEFLEVSRPVVTDDDFIGSFYQVEYVIHREKLKKGRQFGKIVVRSPYQELVYYITASRGAEVRVKVSIYEKQQKLSLLEDLLNYFCGKMEFKTWMGSSRFILNQLREEGCDYPEFQMYEAYLYHLEENEEEAQKILIRLQDMKFSQNNLELAGAYLYLCTMTGLYKDKGQAAIRLQNFYMQKGDSFFLFWLLLQLDSSISRSDSQTVFMMEELFEKGCRSPFLYLQAWKYISKDMTLLHRMSRFWAQVFLFAGKKELLTEELSMRFAYLTGYEKEFCTSTYRGLALCYDAFPSDDTLEAVCRYIMLGNPRNPEYFRWFSLAVEHGLRLTRLYEYYVETMDTSYQRELPKSLLMYFTYNNNSLGDDKKAFIYASITANKIKQPQTYAEYRDNMERFTLEKAEEGRMNENYAVLYQEFLTDPSDSEQAEKIAGMMFTRRLYCDDRKIRYVIVRHSQLEKEECYPCIQGVAYPRIYTEDGVILFQDEQQRRYSSTVDYNVKKLFDERDLVEKVLDQGVTKPGILLHYCENTAPDSNNLEIFRKAAEEEAFSKEYRKQIRSRLLDYYIANEETEDVDRFLCHAEGRQYSFTDRSRLLELLISRGLFTQAMAIVSDLGCDGVSIESLLKLVSRMILSCDMKEDEELLALAYMVYKHGKYDEVILKYLMLYRNGSVEDLLALWRSAQGFDIDTYDLDEKILGFLMLTSDYRKDGEKILADYVKRSGKERIIGAYLTQTAYGVFVKEYPVSVFVKDELEYAYRQNWPVNFVCSLALLLALSREKKLSKDQLEIEKKILEKCIRKNMEFAFFKRLPSSVLSSYQLDDKTFVEYHTDPKAKVVLYYALDTGLGTQVEYKAEPLHNIYEGIFVKSFTLFYGESLRYYFKVEKDGQTHKTQEKIITMSKVEGIPVSKYQLINQMLSARRLGKNQEVLAQMKKYLRQEQYVKEMFTIEKETQEN